MSEIRTVEDLAALPAGSVLRKASGQIVWLALREGRVVYRYWSDWGELSAVGRYLPLTLLYRPDWPTQPAAVARAEAAEQALQRVRELIDAWDGFSVDTFAVLRALDEPTEPEALDD